MAKRNEPIGTCECPVKGCDKIVPVYRYRSRTENVARQRHAGRLYLTCPDHGKSEAQEWILEHADITGEAPKTDTPKEPIMADDKKTEPKKDDDKKKGDDKKKNDDKKDGWGFF